MAIRSFFIALLLSFSNLAVSSEVFQNNAIYWQNNQPIINSTNDKDLELKKDGDVYKIASKRQDYFAKASRLNINLPRVSVARLTGYTNNKNGKELPVYEMVTQNLDFNGQPERVVRCKQNSIREKLEDLNWLGRGSDLHYECRYASATTCRELAMNLKKYGPHLAECQNMAEDFANIFSYTKNKKNGDSYKSALKNEMSFIRSLVDIVPEVEAKNLHAALAIEGEQNIQNKTFWSMLAFDDLEQTLDLCNSYFKSNLTQEIKNTIDKAKNKKSSQ